MRHRLRRIARTAARTLLLAAVLVSALRATAWAIDHQATTLYATALLALAAGLVLLNLYLDARLEQKAAPRDHHLPRAAHPRP